MASQVSYQPANAIRKGGYAILKGKPCKILEFHWSKPGKHGAGKILFVGLDVFTSKKVEDSMPSTSTIEVPEITKKDLQVSNIDEVEGQVTVLAEDCKPISLILPKGDQGDEMVEAFNKLLESGEEKVMIATVANIMGRESIMSWKYGKQP